MPFNGSGTFAVYTPGTPYVNGTTIDETVVNAAQTDFATGLTNCVTRDGQSPATANLPMGGFRHTGVANASTRAVTPYASAADVQDGTLMGLTGVAGTNTITATAAISMTAYATNQVFLLKPAVTNTGATTVSLNSIGAKNVFANGTACAGGELVVGVPCYIAYDGTQFNILGFVGSGPYLLTGVAGTNTVTANGPAVVSLYNGLKVLLTPAVTNTAATTLNITPSGGSALTAKNVFSWGAACAGGELVAGTVYELVYDGTQFNIINPSAPTLTNSLGGDVSANNTANYFTGPTVAQGTVGKWLATGKVTVRDNAGGAQFYAKLWDGTTVGDSGNVTTSTVNAAGVIALSAVFTSPAGNITISVRDPTSTSGKIAFNETGNSKDSTLTVVRIG